MNARIQVAPAVAAALTRGAPVVALETTLVTHGLPQPDGLSAAIELEETVATRGALPATIGILGGTIHVGMNRGQLERLANSQHVSKVNTGNLAAILAAGTDGSTTVAATLYAADATGIRVFATGGIGGVHRHAETTGDVSADLIALARHRVAVVCAGAKAILDLPRTVEMLETLGVPVLGLDTEEFPAFYRRSSGLRLDRRCPDVAAVAAAARPVVDAVRAGAGPGALLIHTYRLCHHSKNDDDRPADEVAGRWALDPLVVHGRRLDAATRGCVEEQVAAALAEVAALAGQAP